MTVRLRLRDALGRDQPVRARTIFHDHRLAEPLRHLRRHQPRQDVDPAAGRKPDHDPDRPRREPRLRDRAAREQRGRSRAEYKSAPCRRTGQGIPPVLISAGVGAIVIVPHVGIIRRAGSRPARTRPAMEDSVTQAPNEAPNTAARCTSMPAPAGTRPGSATTAATPGCIPNSHSGMYLEARVWSLASHPGDARAAVRRHRHGHFPVG